MIGTPVLLKEPVEHLHVVNGIKRPRRLQRHLNQQARHADRIAAVIASLPVKTAVFFPSFDLLQRVLDAGLQSSLPGNVVIEYAKMPSGDLWRSIEGWKRDPQGTVLLGVTGGRLAEGIDYPDEELEAVVIVGIPYPKPTARAEALRRFLDSTTGKGWEYTVEAPAARAMLQAFGRMIRSEHDRGLAIVLDKRATAFARWFPGLEPIGNLAATTRAFYGGRRARWSPSRRRGSDGSAPDATVPPP
jgi:DNA excision repair protein ERCC-2